MSKTLTIARRELTGYFNGPAAYIVICLFLTLLGIFFWSPFFLVNRSSVRGLFDMMSVLLLPTTAAITMGLLAEEKRTGTIETLLTMPIRDTEVIVGKFLGALSLLVVLLVLTIPYPMSVHHLGRLDTTERRPAVTGPRSPRATLHPAGRGAGAGSRTERRREHGAPDRRDLFRRPRGDS